MPKNADEMVTLRMPSKTRKRLDRLAAKQRRTRSAEILLSIDNHLAEDGKNA